MKEMLSTAYSSPYYDQVLRHVAPLYDHFGINHFWYYKITFSGHYFYIGTHADWSEFCFNNDLTGCAPCIRHPRVVQKGLQLMSVGTNEEFKEVLKVAWKKFRINFNINLVKSIPDGIEAFGFGTHFNDPHSDERLLNELPLLRYFIKDFQIKYEKYFRLVENYQIDLASMLGPVFYERSQTLTPLRNREQFLSKMGFEWVSSLTPRELDVLQFISNGYPASFIAQQLQIGNRTVEHYIAIIKNKLLCNSKTELIQKAQELYSIGYFD